MKRLIVVLFVLAMGFPSVCLAGAFGFEYGMTKQQVINLVGRKAVKTEKEDLMTLSTAPKPHPLFDSYGLVFSPKQGLVKIWATGVTVDTNGYGIELLKQFTRVKEAISTKYGASTVDNDFLSTGSIWNEPKDWMMALLKKERKLESVWIFDPAREHIQAISISTAALNMSQGWVTVAYEFEGWGDYLDERNSKADSAF